MTHLDPTAEQLAALAADERTGPLVMLNLNRYRERAAYPDDRTDGSVSGRDAYLRYGLVAARAIAEVGGRMLWGAPVEQVAVGCDHEDYDEVVAVWYPSRAAFLSMLELPWYREALVHRIAALDRASVIACHGAEQPVLASPFGD